MQLLSLMNTKDENGKYIFSGSKGDTAPFSRKATELTATTVIR